MTLLSRAGAAVDAALASTILAGTLLLAYPFGNLAAYLLMFASLAAALRVVLSGGPLWLPQSWAATLLIMAFALLAFAFAFENIAYATNFLMFVLFAPLGVLLARRAGPGNAVVVATLALVGAAISTGIAAYQFFVLNDGRAPSFFSDPIWSAQAAVVLGFTSCIGLAAVSGGRRYLFLLGPLLATTTTFLSGSRGPLVAAPLLLLVVVLLGARRRGRALLFGSIAIVAVLALGAGTLHTFMPSEFARLSRVPAVAMNILTGAEVTTRSEGQRLAFYSSSWAAFQAQPWLGYGWGGKMDAIVPYLADGGRMLREGHHHLHSDILDFGVSAGIFGLAAYLLVLAAPIAGALASPRDSQYRARLLGVSVLVVGYFICGLTYLTFGYEYGTTIYVCLAAILLGYCRDVPVLPQRQHSAEAPPLSA